jgi:hypothetical protein
MTGGTREFITGQSAEATNITEPPPDRTFAEAERLGQALAQSVCAAPMTPLEGPVAARSAPVTLPLARTETGDLDALAREWSALAETAAPAWAALYRHWANWARTAARAPLRPWQGRVTVFDWSGLPLIFLPGEIFAGTALTIRAALPASPVPVVVSLADGVPGYIPPREAYPVGGYEVAEAHRYYGLPAAFAPGAAEALVDAVIGDARR